MAGRVKYWQLGSKAWLLREYVDNRRDQKDIAAEVGCTSSAVAVAMRRFGIEARPAGGEGRARKHHLLWDEAWLRSQYVEKGRAQSEIAEMVDAKTTSVTQALRHFGIEVRERSYLFLPADLLAELRAAAERRDMGVNGLATDMLRKALAELDS